MLCYNDTFLVYNIVVEVAKFDGNNLLGKQIVGAETLKCLGEKRSGVVFLNYLEI